MGDCATVLKIKIPRYLLYGSGITAYHMFEIKVYVTTLTCGVIVLSSSIEAGAR